MKSTEASRAKRRMRDKVANLRKVCAEVIDDPNPWRTQTDEDEERVSYAGASLLHEIADRLPRSAVFQLRLRDRDDVQMGRSVDRLWLSWAGFSEPDE